MKLSYTVQVCNESRELYSLLNFLIKVIDKEDEILVIVDSLHVTDKVKLVLKHFEEKIIVYERPFDTFYLNTTFTLSKCTGDYVFILDADEMPQELLIKELKKVLSENNVDILYWPRINIHPGVTQEFLTKNKFKINQCGWINWPDHQGRILKKDIQMTNELHTKPITTNKIIGSLGENPQCAVWHIKSIEKQESRWVNDEIASPSGSLYDLLM
jgi:hypothetical protein